ncbi:protein ROS1 [Abrus precatorius]|uniref:Protein ROS1 n=1 Tax=Abrus precatorius TaxID=3816 RepID=A0A8B8L0U3_ABRPR|nr:protein ROS1 [Abrus precatorius]
MEVGEADREKLQVQVPWIPTTPLKPILPRPGPILVHGEGNQLGSHSNEVPACWESSACAEIRGRLHYRSEPPAEAYDKAESCVRKSFGHISSPSNGIAELLAQADAPSTYSIATHDVCLKNQFIPTFKTQFNPTYALHSHHHLSRGQPVINTIHDKYQDVQGTPYFAYYSKTTHIAPPTPDTATPMNREERGQGVEENVPATKYNYPHKAAVASTPCKENHNRNKELSHDIDLNKVPQSKTKRKKHRPKVVIEGKPQRTRKPVTPKPVQPKENPTGTRKSRRKGLNMTSTPQTEVREEWTKPLMPESTIKTCRRSINFDVGEQPPRDDISTCREIGVVIEGAQALNNSLSKSVAQSSPKDSNSSNSESLTTRSRLHVNGPKRKHSSTMEHAANSSINLIGAQYNAVQAYCLKSCVQFPNVHKKKRTDKGKFSYTSNTPCMTATKDVEVATCPPEDGKSHPSSRNYQTAGSAFIRVPVTIEETENMLDKPQSLGFKLSSGQRRSRVPARIHDCASSNLFRSCDTKLAQTTKQAGSSGRQTFGVAERLQTCADALSAEMQASLTKKKRTKKRTIPVSSAYSCTDEMQQHSKFVLENQGQYLHNSSDAASEEIWKNIQTVDALTERFSHLSICREATELVLHEQNAIVPYDQQNDSGTIIPFKGPLNPIKKQHPRPKVDLDEDTNGVWKLLMLDINSHGIDGTDELKAKWWEEERNVFRGRADSFIARMHLVQGDRRFSKWKGSVVDSVVGVFLTQNVADHLSSSAFMSLAARFPPSNKHKTYHKESRSLIVTEPQVQIVEPEANSTVDEKTLNQSVNELGSMPVDIIKHSEDREAVDSNDSCRTTGGLISLTDESTQRHIREHSPVESGPIIAVTEEGQENLCHGGIGKALNDVFSSQCSAVTSQISGDCFIDQNPEKIRSFSDSNSTVEDKSSAAKHNLFNNRTSFSKLLEMASSTMLHEVNCQSGKSLENLRDKYGQSLGMNIDNLAQNLEKSNVSQASLEESIISCNEYTLKMTPNSGLLEVNCYDPLKIEVPSTSSSKNKDENDKRVNFPTTESDSHTAITQSQGQTQDTKKKAREIKKSKKGSSSVKQKRRKRGKKKKAKFNWDSLRIQAQATAGKREKTENTMDSLDWDAVRRADVNEIADIIKERGMNNMLAERIKNFLNLLVDVHGAIDLEWLRDVPPDKAKEYLLSVKGLGLKSVECVRLLTLHHLAFPVDTNVGRIAVRLGWVPLQPLPESLQLHLLELYPVLESIQKYLWPRLCKLDQRTLYELHYQLITFGKVFCTKSKPNCNACPMRGECRHFASAFASARLTLPGPEQKSITITTGKNATYQNPSVVISQVPFPLLENTNQAEELQQTEGIQQLEAKSEINICQPIIEEPASPEPGCSQVSENDIEDACYEESCKIPTIKLDIEEFTLNLQNYMQQNMELQEGEMSKAMVALDPDAARIPMPKLKNASRLRTEHYVYELPDSHCLLEGWDKREPDDPGTYLLAIWTPGETAHSIQPPERKCSSQDSGQLCNEKECFSCNSFREANSQIVRGTILIPCRTAMRGSFPLNGTYFQVNEVFADHDSSLNPISVPRSWIWNLNRRTVYFGTSVSTIFKGLSTRDIQQCFWKGYVCLRGFDRETRAPRPLMARLHFPASKSTKKKDKTVFPSSKLPEKDETKKRSTSANPKGSYFKAKAKITFEDS